MAARPDEGLHVQLEALAAIAVNRDFDAGSAFALCGGRASRVECFAQAAGHRTNIEKALVLKIGEEHYGCTLTRGNAMAEVVAPAPSEEATAAASDEIVVKVSDAIKNSRFLWRTPDGIAKELGLPVETVQTTLEYKPQFIRSAVSSKTGKVLYTSTEKREDAGFASRFLSAWANTNV
jgi:hypothetical protein